VTSNDSNTGDGSADEAVATAADPDWFRPPTRREHAIGAALFVGFGIFFVLLFVLLRGWWFRWVVLTLGVYSIIRGLRHLLGVVEPSIAGGNATQRHRGRRDKTEQKPQIAQMDAD
jgi:hypothetical protein